MKFLWVIRLSILDTNKKDNVLSNNLVFTKLNHEQDKQEEE